MATSSDVAALIRQGQRLLSQGDEEGAHEEFTRAGDKLYADHKDELLGHCTWKLRSTADGKDMTQDIFRTLWVKMPELEDPDGVAAWLHGVRDNKILQEWRNSGRRATKRAERGRRIAEEVHREPEATPEEAAVSEAEEQEREELLRRLPGALEKLDEEDVLMLKMRIQQGLSFRVIASASGKSESTVSRRIPQLLALLNEELKNQQDQESRGAP